MAKVKCFLRVEFDLEPTLLICKIDLLFLYYFLYYSSNVLKLKIIFYFTASEAHYTFERMQLLSLKQYQDNGSPTRCLLWELGCAGYKVRTLYEKLQKAARRREMQILEEYGKYFFFPLVLICIKIRQKCK